MLDRRGLRGRRHGWHLRSCGWGGPWLGDRLGGSFGFRLWLSLLHQHGGRRLGRLRLGFGLGFDPGLAGSGRGTLHHAHGGGGLVQGEGGSLMLSLGLALETPAQLIRLVIGEVGAMALPLEAQTLLTGLDDLLIGDSELFGELVDAQHVRG
jgi:hypothetical protein